MRPKRKFQNSDIPMKDRLLMNKFATVVANGRLYGAVDENGNTVSTKELEVPNGGESKK